MAVELSREKKNSMQQTIPNTNIVLEWGMREPQPVSADFTELCRHLLALGGQRVVVPPGSIFLKELLERGYAMNGTVKYRRGQQSDCHGNAIRYILRFPTHRMATGFALSDDGLWRRHSWVLSDRGHLIETTIPRLLYFGIVLSPEETTNFIEMA